MLMGVVVGRHINGITLNKLEYLLDDDGNELIFENEELAKVCLRENGCAEKDLEWFVFEEVK